MLKKQIIDQSAHFLLAMIFVAILPGNLMVLTGLLLGFILGIIRETLQHKTLKIWTLGKGSYLDILFWTLGGGFGVYF